MSESYCMKPCSECGGCSGCRAGEYSAQCDIAKCCREKWHLSCESCTRCGGCPTRLSRDRMPGMIQERERKAAQVLQGQKQRVRIMNTWLPMIFGALIANFVVGLLLGLFDTDAITMLDMIRGIVNACLIFAAGFGFWKLQEVDDGFYFVAICHWLTAVYDLLVLFLLEEGTLNKILTLLLAVVSVVSMRSEYLGFRDALSGIHQELSEKWEKQWTQMVYALALLVVSFLLLLIPLLGVIVLLVGLIFFIFLLIRNMVYLYQTMEFCREYDLG